MDSSSSSLSVVRSTDETIEEIMKTQRSLPTRPKTEEVEAAITVIENAEREEASKLKALPSSSSKNKSSSSSMAEELLTILQEMQKSIAHYECKEKKRDALKLLDLENVHVVFDDLILRTSNCVSNSKRIYSSANGPKAHNASSPNFVSSSGLFNKEDVKEKKKGLELRLFAKDDSYLNNNSKSKFNIDGYAVGQKFFSKPKLVDNSSTIHASISGEKDGGENRLSLIKLANLIEVYAKKGICELNLQNKLKDKVDWLPDSLGKLSSLITLDLSQNRIITLPFTIGKLSSLTHLDLHSNQIKELPNSIENLINLSHLNVSGNMLSSLPHSLSKLARLKELNLNSNQLSSIPDSIGSLVKLKVLNVETNDIEEIPHSIGHCASLKELCADYNRLKALPEAIGQIKSLEILSVRYNNIKQLPTTMSNMINLKELNVSFNELEFIPESLCFATKIVKMNVGNNFADMRSLPRSIGNLEMLEELDISNNQIHILPDSFRMLTHLRILRVEENPLEVPPRHIVEKGAQAVVQYMAELVEKRDVKSQLLRPKKSWTDQICFFSKSNKRKRERVDYVNA
ncbi:leucine-rich repeat protein shoc-2-like [Trifolium pratense]|uniref:Leucine-rich repeat protein shoc-2-like n=1 Tax=Trifolium pratense TaxID=57577 RepID=A0A2K3P6A0_TRIPR|nr:leucine-rich repeat protein shoc-2-like [Trifolium pratense]